MKHPIQPKKFASGGHIGEGRCILSLSLFTLLGLLRWSIHDKEKWLQLGFAMVYQHAGATVGTTLLEIEETFTAKGARDFAAYVPIHPLPVIISNWSWSKSGHFSKGKVLYMGSFRWRRQWRSKGYKRNSGSNHILELTRERRLLAEYTKTPITQGANMLYITNVDSQVSKQEIENFFNFWYGEGSCNAKLIKNKTTGCHRGFGYLKFTDPKVATMALLTFNGAKIGDRNVLLMEAYLRNYLCKQMRLGKTLASAAAAPFKASSLPNATSAP